ncbi:MAG: adenylate/guanylate cyclase domain-containing protein [Magnetococcales bacterium]|nr:adenylate/guanylate cyclase domain-containing protein [Magnetococcales bacterium]
MKSTDQPDSGFHEQPFPLRRLFLRWFVPAMLGFIVVFLVIIGLVSKKVVESIYLEQAQRQAQAIAKSVAIHAPEAWKGLMRGQSTPEMPQAIDSRALVEAFASQVRELKLLNIKVYGLDRHVLFATYQDQIGVLENGPALRTVLKTATPGIVKKTQPNGSRLYELYVPVFDDSGILRTVFELYEPVDYLDEIMVHAMFWTLVIPGLFLSLLFLALDKLVDRAQVHIDARTFEANDLRHKVESFVSSTAAKAAKMAGLGGAIPSRTMVTTLFYSDIRDFSGFSEKNPPETVVDFLNGIMTLQVSAIQRHSGDVDKMIGDAVLARFDGVDGHRRAIAASREILHALKKGTFPRRLGIGVHWGNVISGAIGPEDRRDFTVIGDAVNVAARLCAAAKVDELVIDADLADEQFDREESIHVKGRVQPVVIRRWTVSETIDDGTTH